MLFRKMRESKFKSLREIDKTKSSIESRTLCVKMVEFTCNLISFKGSNPGKNC